MLKPHQTHAGFHVAKFSHIEHSPHRPSARSPQALHVSHEVAVQIENDIRYAGYLRVEQQRIKRRRQHGEKPIPEGFDYCRVRHLRAEAREKLEKIRPRTLSQAGRVSGITPTYLTLATNFILYPALIPYKHIPPTLKQANLTPHTN